MSQKLAKTKSAYNPFVPAVEQASRVLICLGKSPSPGMNLTEICNETGIHKSKGYSILHTLTAFGFVEKNTHTKQYSLGPGLIHLSRKALDNIDARTIAAPYLRTLGEKTLSTALFGLINADQVFVVAKSEGSENVGVTIRLGHRFHITWGAHGKALVAFMPEDEKQRILNSGKSYFYSPEHRTDFRKLMEELDKIRRTGYAWDIGGLEAGIQAISAPVFDVGRKLIGCIILMGTYPEEQIREFGILVMDAARQVSSRLGANMGD